MNRPRRPSRIPIRWLRRRRRPARDGGRAQWARGPTTACINCSRMDRPEKKTVHHPTWSWAPTQFSPPWRLRPVRRLEGCDVQLHQLQQRIRHPLRPGTVLVAYQLVQDGGNDLPAEPEPVDEPAAGLRLAASLEQGIPVAIELRLIVAEHDHRDRVVEVMVWPCGHGLEALAQQREVHDLHGPWGAAGAFAEHRRDPVHA